MCQSKPTQIEEEVAKVLKDLEMNKGEHKDRQWLQQIFINKADEVSFRTVDGDSKAIVVRIPFLSLAAYQKVANVVIDHLEGKFKCAVFVIATRTIISKHGKCVSLTCQPSATAPRSAPAAAL